MGTQLNAMEKFRSKVLERASGSIKGIGRTFRIYDDDGNKNLNLEEFQEGVKDYGLDLTGEEVKELFSTMDKDGSGELSFDEFLIGLRGQLNQKRLESVKRAFHKAD